MGRGCPLSSYAAADLDVLRPVSQLRACRRVHRTASSLGHETKISLSHLPPPSLLSLRPPSPTCPSRGPRDESALRPAPGAVAPAPVQPTEAVELVRQAGAAPPLRVLPRVPGPLLRPLVVDDRLDGRDVRVGIVRVWEVWEVSGVGVGVGLGGGRPLDGRPGGPYLVI